MNTPPTLKPIETIYNGYRFRSRLEARWAVFFDQVGIKYAYEAEGYQGNGVWYLPDFQLKEGVKIFDEEQPRQNVWVEVKPSLQLSVNDRRKIGWFARQPGVHILVIGGEPGADFEMRFVSFDEEVRRWNAPFVKWVELSSGNVGILSVEYLNHLPNNELKQAVVKLTESVNLNNAITVARQERFETAQKVICISCGKTFVPKNPYYKYCLNCYMQQRGIGPEETVPEPTNRVHELKQASPDKLTSLNKLRESSTQKLDSLVKTVIDWTKKVKRQNRDKS